MWTALEQFSGPRKIGGTFFWLGLVGPFPPLHQLVSAKPAPPLADLVIASTLPDTADAAPGRRPR